MCVEYDIAPANGGFWVDFEANDRLIGNLTEIFPSIEAALAAILASPRPEFRSAVRKVSRESLRLWADNTPQIKRLFIWKHHARPCDFNLAVELYLIESDPGQFVNDVEKWKREVSSRVSRRVVEIKLAYDLTNPADQVEEVYFRHARGI